MITSVLSPNFLYLLVYIYSTCLIFLDWIIIKKAASGTAWSWSFDTLHMSKAWFSNGRHYVRG
jgi:hypothetical protein